MDFSAYVSEKMAAARLEDLRRESAQVALLESVSPGRRPIGVALGAVLIRMGRWMAQERGAAGRNAGVRVGH